MRRCSPLLLCGFLLFSTPALLRADDAAEKKLIETIASEKLFLRGEYKATRSVFAKYFEEKYADKISEAFKDQSLQDWLTKYPEARDTLFTAIDPEHDNIEKCLEIFRKLYEHDPKNLHQFHNLAVALAVTWDKNEAVYDYRHHQVRTKSDLPETVAKTGYIENYDMLTKIEGPIKQAVQFFPWEFLVHVVNHRTPEDERKWALKNYTAKRSGIGKSFFDIEYDKEMLRTRSEVCKLNGKPYTLQSIKQHGGVCAMQADFAARVAKSLVVPAEYVRGEGNSGGLHAWVMWVEVRAVNKDKIDFVLMSEGRYDLDQYYVGTLLDPKSGKEITDRDLERRLTFVGFAPHNARHADLLMRSLPLYAEAKKFEPKQYAEYIRKVHEIFPTDERAWLKLAQLYKNGDLKDSANAMQASDKALVTFAKFPDFSWKLVDDLLTPVKDKAQRTRLFERIVTSYETLSRPDLACEARLKLVEYQVEATDHKKAADGLANTIRKFPAEGRYVPKMMQKLAEVCKEFKGGTDLLGKFYIEILPKVPARRGSDLSEYCIKFHEQAVEFFEANNKTKEATLVKQQIELIRAGKVK